MSTKAKTPPPANKARHTRKPAAVHDEPDDTDETANEPSWLAKNWIRLGTFLGVASIATILLLGTAGGVLYACVRINQNAFAARAEEKRIEDQKKETKDYISNLYKVGN